MKYAAADSVISTLARESLPDKSAIVIVRKSLGVIVISYDRDIRDKASRDVVEALQYDKEIDTSSMQYLCFKCPDMVESWCTYLKSDYTVSLVTYTHSPVVKKTLSAMSYTIRKILEEAYDNDDLTNWWKDGV
jgi:hypothetical protein